MTRFGPVVRVFGLLLMGFAGTVLLPLAVAWFMDDGAAPVFRDTFIVTLAAGLLIWWLTHRHKRELKVRDGFLLVVLLWTVFPAFAALPFVFHLDATFTAAYFEATSGLTATGATVFTGLDTMPLSINFWRTFLHWIGGMGVVVLAVAILPLLGIGGRQMFKAETPGPMKDNRLTPRVTETARGLWRVYVLFTVLCALGFWQFGMPGWDAVMHAFSVMGLGGFSSKDASLGYYHSIPIELTAMLFALLSGMSYATHFLALNGRSLRPYLRDPEVRYYLGVLAASILMLTVYLQIFDVYADGGEALRYVAFHTISIATSLGFATTDYAQWPMFAQLWILFLGSFAACSASTGGGIKMIRAIILYKQVHRELVRAIHPHSVSPVQVAGMPVAQEVLSAVMAFGFIYTVSVVTLTLVLAMTGLDIVTAFSAIVATMNNTGPGLNLVGPSSNFGVLGGFQTWVCSFAMLLGRLEIFTLLVVLTPAFWRR